jgi:cytochrome b pre-mRNA-processing protein 3
MIRALFARLTGGPKRGEALYRLAVEQARDPRWFVEGEIPDTVNGRFAVLATVIALTTVRLEREGEVGQEATVALTESLVESLDVELREMGLGDPTLGKQVRKLVGAVSGRVERWSALVEGDQPWSDEVRRNLYLEEEARDDAVRYSESALRTLWKRLADSTLEDLSNGRMG